MEASPDPLNETSGSFVVNEVKNVRFIVDKVKFIGNGLKLIGNKVKFIGKGVKFIGIVGYVIISLQQFQSIRIITIMLNIRSELTQQKSLDGVVAR